MYKPPMPLAPHSVSTEQPRENLQRRPTYVATSYICDRETRELGEDYAELRKIARAYRLLERRLSAAQPRLRSRRALSTVMDFSLALADANHDEGLGSTASLARDAFVEARVVRITHSFTEK